MQHATAVTSRHVTVTQATCHAAALRVARCKCKSLYWQQICLISKFAIPCLLASKKKTALPTLSTLLAACRYPASRSERAFQAGNRQMHDWETHHMVPLAFSTMAFPGMCFEAVCGHILFLMKKDNVTAQPLLTWTGKNTYTPGGSGVSSTLLLRGAGGFIHRPD